MADVELGRWKEPHGARCGRENLSLPRDDVVVDVDASRSRRTETIVFLELISRSSAFDPPTFSSALASSTRSSWKRYDFPRSFFFPFLFLSLLSRVSRYETLARNEPAVTFVSDCFKIRGKLWRKEIFLRRQRALRFHKYFYKINESNDTFLD